ncbi:hypothetical protein BKH43_01660 [Helicobacter sp. 13S00401-1]|uniref:hypothetical protein n=1 Tax=Helicobacter sp. 13S00401-1 TaxID=1905758 RepID=UPI000BA698C2|nr:hypothetical protein [Helicobacter sp. 13S00401-1]PAF51373.1 hypothetical protein BKH43_01660 [Helicobacter sp. 13S00401-1]
MKFFKVVLVSLSLSGALFAAANDAGSVDTDSTSMGAMNLSSPPQDSAQASALKELQSLTNTMSSFVNSMPSYITPSLNYELSTFLSLTGLKQSDLKCELNGDKANCKISDSAKKKNFIQDFSANEAINSNRIDSKLNLIIDKKSDFYISLRDNLKPLIPNKLECKNIDKIEGLEYKSTSNCVFNASNAEYKLNFSGYKHDSAYKSMKIFDKKNSMALKAPSDYRIGKLELVLDMGIIKTTILEFMNNGSNPSQKIDFNSAVAGLQTISMMMIPQAVSDPEAISLMNTLANEFFLALRSNKKYLDIKISEKPTMHNASVDMVKKSASELTNADLDKGLKIFASQYDFKISSF